MLPIVDKPTIQYIIEEAVASGIEDIIIVTGKGKRAIEDHFDYSFELEQNLAGKQKWDLLNEVRKPSDMADIHYIRQKNRRASAMPSGAHASLSGTNRLLFFSGMTSWNPSSLVWGR